MPRIYRIEYIEKDEGYCVEWAGSVRAAMKVKNRLEADDISQAMDKHAQDLADDLVERGVTYHGYKQISDITISSVNFPTTKKAILNWLNANLNKDNG